MIVVYSFVEKILIQQILYFLFLLFKDTCFFNKKVFNENTALPGNMTRYVITNIFNTHRTMNFRNKKFLIADVRMVTHFNFATR